MSDSFRPHGLQHARPPCPSPTLSLPKLMSIESVMPSNHLILCCPLPPSTFPSIRVFSVGQLFTSGGQSFGVSDSPSVLPKNIRDSYPLGLDGSSLSPRDSQESSPTPQFKSIDSSMHSYHYSPTLTSLGEGNGNPLQCSCLENPRDRGAWWAAVYGVAQSQTRLKRLSSSSSRPYYWKNHSLD